MLILQKLLIFHAGICLFIMTSFFSRDVRAVAAEAPGATAATVVTVVTVVTRVVGQVDTHFLTSREVRIDDAIDQALDATAAPVSEASGSAAESTPSDTGLREAARTPPRRGATGAGGVFKGKILTGEEKTFPNNVSKSLDQWMISLEAQSLQANPPQASEVSATLKRVSEYWGSRQIWKALEVSGAELNLMIARKLLARNFEDFKNNVATAPVSDTDALSYYQRNHARFGNVPFATFKENIKSFLTRQQMEVRMNEWLEVLRRKYKVRNFIAG